MRNDSPSAFEICATLASIAALIIAIIIIA
jgi:hypothetical protein